MYRVLVFKHALVKCNSLDVFCGAFVKDDGLGLCIESYGICGWTLFSLHPDTFTNVYAKGLRDYVVKHHQNADKQRMFDTVELALTGVDQGGIETTYYVALMDDLSPPVSTADYYLYNTISFDSFVADGTEQVIELPNSWINKNGYTSIQIKCAEDVQLDTPSYGYGSGWVS